MHVRSSAERNLQAPRGVRRGTERDARGSRWRERGCAAVTATADSTSARARRRRNPSRARPRADSAGRVRLRTLSRRERDSGIRTRLGSSTVLSFASGSSAKAVAGASIRIGIACTRTRRARCRLPRELVRACSRPASARFLLRDRSERVPSQRRPRPSPSRPAPFASDRAHAGTTPARSPFPEAHERAIPRDSRFPPRSNLRPRLVAREPNRG